MVRWIPTTPVKVNDAVTGIPSSVSCRNRHTHSTNLAGSPPGSAFLPQGAHRIHLRGAAPR